MEKPAAHTNTQSAQVEAYFKVLERGAGKHPYASLLGLKTYDSAGLHQRVKAGLSFAAVEHLIKALDIPTPALAEALHISPRTFQRRKEAGRLMPDESDRVVRLSRILGKALELFEGDIEGTRSWLTAPLPALGNVSPLELAQTEPGAGEVEALIGRLEHGVFA